MHFEQHERLPNWISALVTHAKPIKVPHVSKFRVVHDETNILLTGVPDEIFHKSDGSYFIIDYKTAKFTEGQNQLLPMYQAQLNAYAYIAERIGFKPVSGLGLIYYEPLTEVSVEVLDSVIFDRGFSMRFLGKLLPINLNPDSIPHLLKRVREIYDQPRMPKEVEGCRDCQMMQVMSNLDPMAKLIELGQEERYLEYKASAPWGDLKLKITKTAMGMANIKDGGTILIGVTKNGNQYIPEGIQEEHLTTYNPDEVQAFINSFADPYVRTQVQEVKWNDKKFLAIVVHEFDEFPVVCKRDSNKVLRHGAIYTRSHRIPETCEVRSQSEMRELIKMAIEKGVHDFAKMAQPLY